MPQKSRLIDFFQRMLRDGGDAVIALLAVDLDMLVAELAEGLERELVVRTFRFLQAQHVGLPLLQEGFHDRQAKPDGVDVPGGD
jgi:hypothetical protein